MMPSSQKDTARTKKKTKEFMLMYKYGIPKFGTSLHDHNEYVKQLRPAKSVESTESTESTEIMNCSPSVSPSTEHDTIDKIDHTFDQLLEDIPSTPSTPDIMEFPRKCPQCEHEIQSNQEYTRHMRICDLHCRASSHRTQDRRKAERDADLPAYYELVHQVNRLNRIVAHQQKTIQQLTSWVSSQKRKVSITEWLAEHSAPTSTFYEWVASIRVSTDDIQYLYDHDYFETVANTFRRFLPTDSLQDLPIRAFDQRKGYMYVYDSGTHLRELKIRIKPVEDEEEDEQTRWYCLPVKSMKPILERVIQMYYKAISVWVKEQSQNRSNDTVRMMRMTKKMGTSSDNPNTRILRVMHKVYTHLKESRQMVMGVSV